MNFNMITPCPDCPFRNDRPGFLHPLRAQHIIRDLTTRQQTFACHKTTVSVQDGEGHSEPLHGPKTQHCAGATILLEKIGRPNQMMRWMGRLGGYDPETLDMAAPVFDTPAQFINAHRRAYRAMCRKAAREAARTR